MSDQRPPFLYLTAVQAIAENGRRHMRRAAEHAAAGRFEYADGSAIKASRNLAMAIDVRRLLTRNPALRLFVY